MTDIVFVVCCDALQAADGDGLRRLQAFLDSAATACRLAWPIASAPEDSGKHVRLPIDHVGVAIASRSDQPDIFGHRRVRGTSPLAIDDLMKVIGILDI